MKALLVFPRSVDVLYGAQWFDPILFVGLSLLLAGVALVEGYVSARRVMRVDPMVALRYR
jgi:ABC-type antimicrobial peptide transport system permease subunit